MAAYRRVYDSRQLQADWKESGSAPKPYALQSCIGYLYHFSCSTRGYVVTTGIRVPCDSCSSLRVYETRLLPAFGSLIIITVVYETRSIVTVVEETWILPALESLALVSVVWASSKRRP